MRYLILLFVATLAVSCYREHYATNKFAGIYEITGGTVETWLDGKLQGKENIHSRFKFYLYAPENVNFGNGSCAIDTGGQAPEFLSPLGLDYNAPEGFEWNLGPGDRVRLSFIRSDPNNPGDRASTVNVKRNALGMVKAWTYVQTETQGYRFYTYNIRKLNSKF